MLAAQSDPHEVAKASHDLALWMIQLADSKAGILVAASAILAGLLVPQALHPSNEIAQGVLILAVGLALASSGLSLATVFPRTTPEQHSSLLYFTAILKFNSGEAYHSRLQELKTGEPDRELAQQVWELARTQEQKYLFLRASVMTFVSCLSATFVGLLLTFVRVQ